MALVYLVSRALMIHLESPSSSCHCLSCFSRCVMIPKRSMYPARWELLEEIRHGLEAPHVDPLRLQVVAPHAADDGFPPR